MPITRTHTKRIAAALAKKIGSDKISLIEVDNSFWIIGKEHCIETHYYKATDTMSVVNHLHTSEWWIATGDDFDGNLVHDIATARKACGL